MSTPFQVNRQGAGVLKHLDGMIIMTYKTAVKAAALFGALVVLPATSYAASSNFIFFNRSQGDVFFLKPGAKINAPIAGPAKSNGSSNLKGYVNVGTDRGGRLQKIGNGFIDAPIAGTKAPKSREGYRKIDGNGSIEVKIHQ